MAFVNVHCPRCQSSQVYRHGQTLKAMTDFAAVTATVCFSLLTLMRPVSRALKSRSLKWPSMVPGFAILPEY